MLRAGAMVTDVLNEMESFDFIPTEPQLHRLLTLLSDLSNDLPLWINNGWTPNEVRAGLEEYPDDYYDDLDDFDDLDDDFDDDLDDDLDDLDDGFDDLDDDFEDDEFADGDFVDVPATEIFRKLSGMLGEDFVDNFKAMLKEDLENEEGDSRKK